MSVAILVPILDRPHRIAPLLANVGATTPEAITVIFAASDQPSIDELLEENAWFIQDDGGTWPNRINTLFNATEAPYVFLCADDVLFHDGWLPPLLRAQEEMGGGVAVPDDLHNPNGTLALVSREYVLEVGACIDTPGAVIWPGYSHNWGDTELFATARYRGRFRYAPESVVEHLHHGIGKSQHDATYAKGHATFWDDHGRYCARQHLWT